MKETGNLLKKKERNSVSLVQKRMIVLIDAINIRWIKRETRRKVDHEIADLAFEACPSSTGK